MTTPLYLLDIIPADVFQAVGTFAGLAACVAILVQVVREWKDPNQSTLATAYVAGWLAVFLFWLLYGLRFRAIALWLPNCLAVTLQTAMLVAILRKKRPAPVVVEKA